MAALNYPGAKILKEDDVPTLFPVVEAMLSCELSPNDCTAST